MSVSRRWALSVTEVGRIPCTRGAESNAECICSFGLGMFEGMYRRQRCGLGFSGSVGALSGNHGKVCRRVCFSEPNEGGIAAAMSMADDRADGEIGSVVK